MKKNEIAEKLKANYSNIVDLVDNLDKKEFLNHPKGKWSAGQQTEHLIKSIRPLNLALLLPNFVLKFVLGKAKRPSRTYDELVKKYQSKLHLGKAAPNRYKPKAVSYAEKTALLNTLDKQVKTLTERLATYSEEELDKLILPHPLIGKITLREMMYFTIYHAEHHEKLIRCYSTDELLTKKETG